MRRVVVVGCWLLTGLLVALPRAQPARQPPSLLIRGVGLIDGNGGPVRSGANILARDGRIVSVDAAPTETADVTIDGRGLFLLPGLTDAHVHLSGDPWAESVERLTRVLHGGVTAVYDVAGDVRTTSDLSRAALVGEIDSPTIYYAALFAGPAFFTDPRVIAASQGYKPGDAPWNREITANTDLVRAVAEARGAGATSIKLYAALDADTVRRIGAEARRQDVRLIAHATVFPAKPGDLVAAGVKMLAHTAYLAWEGSPPSPDFPKRARGDFAGVPADGPIIGQLLRSMKDNDVALNPTLWIFAERTPKDDLTGARIAWQNAVTKRAQDIGVVIAAGVDSMTTPNDALPMIHRELEVMVTGAHLTPMQAITSATRGAAHAIGVDADRGTVAVGRVADLLILDADPSVDIRNTRRIRYVIKDGRIVVSQPSRARGQGQRE
jgi:imidazolonepropionase-like amidohydrolase